MTSLVLNNWALGLRVDIIFERFYLPGKQIESLEADLPWKKMAGKHEGVLFQ